MLSNELRIARLALQSLAMLSQLESDSWEYANVKYEGTLRYARHYAIGGILDDAHTFSLDWWDKSTVHMVIMRPELVLGN